MAVIAAKRNRWANYDEVSLPRATKAQLGYLAGIMDGEGTFQASAKSNSFGLKVAMTDLCVIEWLHQHFSGFMSRAGLTKTGTRVYSWGLGRHADLADLLPRLEPYLVCKGPQAKAMLRLVSHLLNPPEWETPTSNVAREERTRRREVAQAWRDQSQELRTAVRNARPKPPRELY